MSLKIPVAQPLKVSKHARARQKKARPKKKFSYGGKKLKPIEELIKERDFIES